MIKLTDGIMIIGTTELRGKMPLIEESIKGGHIILTKKGKPIAVLEDYELHKEKEELFEELIDRAFGEAALERDKSAKGKDFISPAELLKRLEKN